MTRRVPLEIRPPFRGVLRSPFRILGGNGGNGVTVLCCMPLCTDLSFTVGTGPATFTRSTIANYDNGVGVVDQEAIDTPRFQQNGILIEAPSTNECLFSEDHGGVDWVWENLTVTVAQDVVDGTAGIVCDRANVNSSNHTLKQTISIGNPGATYTYSFYAKNLTMTQLKFSIFDVSNGSDIIAPQDYISLVNTETYTRISITFPTQVSSILVNVQPLRNSGVTGQMLIAGSMIEELEFASSYIKTVTSTATRALDFLSIPPINIPPPADDYSVSLTVNLEGDALGAAQSTYAVVGESSRQLFNSAAGSTKWTFVHTNNLVSTDDITTVQPQKLIGTVGATKQALYIDAVMQNSINKGAVTGTKTSITLGSISTFAQVYGNLKNLKIFNGELDQSEVDTVSNVGALPTPLFFMPMVSDLSITNGVGPITYTRASIGTFVPSAGVIDEAATGVPRFEANGFLIERAATNECHFSEDHTNAVWFSADIVVTAAQDTIPGTAGVVMDRLTSSSVNAFFDQQMGVNNVSGYTYSFLIKNESMTSIKFAVFDVGNAVNIIPPTEYISQINSSTYTRITINISTAVGTDLIRVFPICEGSTGSFLYGADQVEELEFASSYIKTLASDVSRASDRLDALPQNLPTTDKNYTVSATVDLIGNRVNRDQHLWRFFDQSREILKTSSAGNRWRVTHGVSLTATSPFTTDQQQIVGVVDEDDEHIYVDKVLEGTLSKTDAEGEQFMIHIGHREGADEFYGHIQSFRIDSVALTQAQIDNLT